MKLINKKTGEIVTLTLSSNGEELLLMKNNEMVARNVKLSDLEEWEDYEEPKGYWYYDTTCCRVEKLNDNEDKEIDSSIGNCFETREEAEKAVEKLKGWKRLKDKGIKFDGYDVAHNGNGELCGQLFYKAGNYCIGDVEKDLDLLFGGEE